MIAAPTKADLGGGRPSASTPLAKRIENDHVRPETLPTVEFRRRLGESALVGPGLPLVSSDLGGYVMLDGNGTPYSFGETEALLCWSRCPSILI